MVNQNSHNSPDTTNILAMFEAADTYNNLEKFYELHPDQVVELQENPMWT